MADDLRDIKGNHLAHMEMALVVLKEDVTVIKTDAKWVKAGLFAILAGIISFFFK